MTWGAISRRSALHSKEHSVTLGHRGEVSYQTIVICVGRDATASVKLVPELRLTRNCLDFGNETCNALIGSQERAAAEDWRAQNDRTEPRQ